MVGVRILGTLHHERRLEKVPAWMVGENPDCNDTVQILTETVVLGERRCATQMRPAQLLPEPACGQPAEVRHFHFIEPEVPHKRRRSWNVLGQLSA